MFMIPPDALCNAVYKEFSRTTTTTTTTSRRNKRRGSFCSFFSTFFFSCSKYNNITPSRAQRNGSIVYFDKMRGDRDLYVPRSGSFVRTESTEKIVLHVTL